MATVPCWLQTLKWTLLWRWVMEAWCVLTILPCWIMVTGVSVIPDLYSDYLDIKWRHYKTSVFLHDPKIIHSFMTGYLWNTKYLSNISITKSTQSFGELQLVSSCFRFNIILRLPGAQPCTKWFHSLQSCHNYLEPQIHFKFFSFFFALALQLVWRMFEPDAGFMADWCRIWCVKSRQSQ